MSFLFVVLGSKSCVLVDELGRSNYGMCAVINVELSPTSIMWPQYLLLMKLKKTRWLLELLTIMFENNYSYDTAGDLRGFKTSTNV